MTRTLLIFCAVAALSVPAALSAKDRAWQTGTLLDKTFNPYFKTVEARTSGGRVTGNSSFVAGDNGVVTVDSRPPVGDVTYENYIIQSSELVYLVEYAHFKNFPPVNISRSKPVTFAIDKSHLYILDLDRHEFETAILKQVDRKDRGAVASTQPAGDAAKPATVATKSEPAKIEQSKVELLTKVEPSKTSSSKPENLFERSAVSDLSPTKPKPAPEAKPAQPIRQVAVVKPEVKPEAKPEPKPQPKVEAKPAPKVQASVAKPAPQSAAGVENPIVRQQPKPEPKVVAAVTKPAPKSETRESRAEGPVVARASTKDRAWQSGQLLSVANNNYFFNVTYTSDMEGSAWPFSQGSDGRLTVTGQIAANTNNPYTYDNYVLESEYVAYLVQRMRPKTSPAVRLPGTKALKFAVDKGKMWVIDEQGVEYEFKVVKLIQKDGIVDPLTRTAAR